jgi:quercetin dioxygenase-like cupin family protein
MTNKMTTAAVCALIALAAARGLADQPAPPTHTMLTPADIQWGEGPPSLPPGAKMAVVYGDPGKPGLFILRARMPANYKIPAHWHPTDETVTVLSGTIMMGMGDKLDAAKAKALPAGSSATMPAKNNHFAMTKKETVIQVTAMGPFEITYVNPDDDPRKAAKTAEKK